MRMKSTCGVLVAIAFVAACTEARREPPLPGDAARGRLLLRQYGCGDCHRIPDVATATATIGPPLEGVGRRVYLAGVLPNSPENMTRWIRSPQSVKPQTLMPDLRKAPQRLGALIAADAQG